MLAKTRLLFISQNYPPSKGGMAESCDRIVLHLRKSGIEVDVLHLFERARYIKTRQHQGGLEFVFPLGADLSHTLNLVHNFLSQTQKQRNWSEIIAYGGYAPIFASPILSKFLKIPFSTFIRGNDFDFAVFNPKRRDILFYALQHSNKICVVSKDKQSKIQDLFPDKSVFYTPNGIDLQSWQAQSSDQQRAQQWRAENIGSRNKVLGLFGHLKEKKGVLFLLEALGQAELYSDIHLLFIGELNEEIQVFLDQYSASIQYQHYPFMDRFSLIPFYLACDALAIPSFYDGMPNVLLEGGSLGIPFLAAKVAGMKDVLEDQKQAFLFPPGDIKAAQKAAFSFAKATPESLVKMGNALQTKIKKSFSVEKETQKYLDILQNI